jgi:pyridinium-3,5-biscarboxylic acid mononucleotide synthase
VQDRLKSLLESFARGEVDLETAISRIKVQSYLSVGDVAKLDICRRDRVGIPEAILAEGKEKQDLLDISLAHLEATGSVIITRVSSEQLDLLLSARLPEGSSLEHNSKARTVVMRRGPSGDKKGVVGILAAGTADMPAAEEARVVAEEMGCNVLFEYDVGVAGIHRLFPCLERMAEADAIVVAAGREGTLPAVVAGLVESPVIGLPVSTGYGLGGGGQAALYSMLQSCSVLTVVNIDAGFVAGAYAAKLARQKSFCQKSRK